MSALRTSWDKMIPSRTETFVGLSQLNEYTLHFTLFRKR